MPRLMTVLTAVVGTVILLSGCGSTTAKPDGHSPSSQPVLVDITIQGNTVTPNGERIDVPLGSLVSLAIHANGTGEIHVHSTPEQEIEYHPGTTRAYLGRFSVPGQVTVESHELDKTVAILVVQ
jgi:hypothetical protein